MKIFTNRQFDEILSEKRISIALQIVKGYFNAEYPLAEIELNVWPISDKIAVTIATNRTHCSEELMGDFSIEAILHGLLSFKAREMNKCLKSHGL